MTNLRRILLLIYACVFALVRGRATRLPRELKRFIVINTAKIGDMVITTSLFRAIKKKFPNAHLAVMGLPVNKQILADNKDVDEYLVSDADPLSLRRMFLQYRADVALLAYPDGATLMGLYLAGVPFIIAPRISGVRAHTETFSYRLLSKLVTTVTYTAYAHMPLEFLKVLSPLGIKTDDTTKHLAFSQSAEEKVKKFLFEHGVVPGEDFIIGIAPSAGNKVKSWLPDRYAELISYLVKKYNAKVIVVGGPIDKDAVDETFQHLDPSPSIINTLSLFPLEELKALIAQMDLFISGDTGSIHIADAFDIPTINILGPVGEIEMPPRGPFHRNVIPPREKPVLFIWTVRTFDKEEARQQLEVTTVEMVTKEVDRLIADLKSVDSQQK